MRTILLRKHSPGFWECANPKDAPLLRHITGGALIVSLLHEYRPIAELHGIELVLEDQRQGELFKTK